MRDWYSKWERIRARGQIAYVLMAGGFGLFYGVTMKAIISLRYREPFLDDLFFLAFFPTMIGLLAGIFFWHRMERKYQRLTTSQPQEEEPTESE